MALKCAIPLVVPSSAWEDQKPDRSKKKSEINAGEVAPVMLVMILIFVQEDFMKEPIYVLI